MDSWQRALKPTIRVIGYSMAIFVIINLLTTLPLFLLKASDEIYNFFGAMNAILYLVGFILSLFKVLDEERLKASLELGKGNIKLL
jgi:ABC-type transport system involved in cytochrome c biogenesis permease subunit